jgi:hypothetical protein
MPYIKAKTPSIALNLSIIISNLPGPWLKKNAKKNRNEVIQIANNNFVWRFNSKINGSPIRLPFLRQVIRRCVNKDKKEQVIAKHTPLNNI